MARGYLSGLIWGCVVAGVGAGGLSLAYPDFKPSGAAQMSESADIEPAALPNAEATSAPEVQSPSAEMQASERSDTKTDESEMVETMTASEATETSDQMSTEAEGETQSEPVQQEETAETDEASETAVAEQETQVAESEQPESMAEETAEIVEQEQEQPSADADPETAAPQSETTPSVTEEIIAALPKTQGTVGDLAPDVKTNRLPSVGDAAEEDSGDAAVQSPLEQFASSYTAEEGKPLMAIVLIDDGESDLGVDALADFPYPLTFAVNAGVADAQARMQTYRDKGFEVLALASLPDGATASDAEVAMSAYLSAIPEAVGVLEAPDVSLQGSREVSDQVTKIVQASGHGLILQSNGLNTAQKLARREGIPSATVFRDFDSKDQKAGVIRRFLDQAAFKAGQEGGVIMQGRLRAETISALLIWGLADRASRVALVPVSAVLTQGDYTR